MGTLAATLAKQPPQAQHPGRCCALRRFFASTDLDDDDRDAIRDVLMDRARSAHTASEILTGVGFVVSGQQVTRHRAGGCRCCGMH
jgi:lipid-binding SYLF domain-containing protein